MVFAAYNGPIWLIQVLISVGIVVFSRHGGDFAAFNGCIWINPFTLTALYSGKSDMRWRAKNEVHISLIFLQFLTDRLKFDKT
jgi:hypothetical protein